MDIPSLHIENERRKLKFTSKYDPETGEGSLLPRFKVEITELGTLWLPLNIVCHKYPFINFIIEAGSFKNACELLKIDPDEFNINGLMRRFEEIRLNEDFEYWAIKCVKIQDKETGKIIPFRLRYAQRKLLYCQEVQHRWVNKPIRINIDKARQWGGSTECQFYIVHKQERTEENYNAIIITAVENQARNIRGMVNRMCKEYPKQYGKIKLVPFEGSSKTKVIEGRGCIIDIGSMEKPEGSRSFNYQAAHLSEVASWKKTEGKEPKDVVQSLSGILYRPGTIIFRETTAKGTGNFWYNEWMDSINGKSGYYPFFIGFWEIEIYQEEIEDLEKFIEEINNWNADKKAYAWWLWSIGATFEAIKWYFNFQERENYDSWRMKAEYPATWEESFQSTGRRVFHPGDVDRMRKTWACKPIFQGECVADADFGPDSLKNIRFVPSNNGNLKIWRMPECGTHRNRYCVPADIGGTTDDADWSVIRVIDRMELSRGGVPEAILTWKGHLPQDLVAWMAVRIGKAYDDGLFVPESNSLKKHKDGDHFLTVLTEIKNDYDNIYCRTPLDKIKEGVPAQYGFHTNSQTKPMVVSDMRKALRNDGYIEYDDTVLVEYDQFELTDKGEYGAVDGAHDDEAMATMIGQWISMHAMEPCTEIDRSKLNTTTRKMVGSGMADF